MACWYFCNQTFFSSSESCVRVLSLASSTEFLAPSKTVDISSAHDWLSSSCANFNSLKKWALHKEEKFFVPLQTEQCVVELVIAKAAGDRELRRYVPVDVSKQGKILVLAAFTDMPRLAPVAVVALSYCSITKNYLAPLLTVSIFMLACMRSATPHS